MKSTKKLAEEFAKLRVSFGAEFSKEGTSLGASELRVDATASSIDIAASKVNAAAPNAAGQQPAPMIIYCQTGTTACSVFLAAALLAEEIGLNLDAKVYDGSWEEWKKRGGPVVGEEEE